MAGEAGAAVARARVQDWEPAQPPRSAAGLSAWADNLIAYLTVCSEVLAWILAPLGVSLVPFVKYTRDRQSSASSLGEAH